MKKFPNCASCGHNRSKCGPDCLLAPYFPSHMHQHYKNAHKVFGESHLRKWLLSIPPRKRSTAMKHIIAEADNRVADLVGGTHALIRNLQLKIAEEEEELCRLRNVIGVFRGRLSVCGAVQKHENVEGCPQEDIDSKDDLGFHFPVLPLVPGGFLQTLLDQELSNEFDLRK